MATATNDKPVRLGDLPVVKTNILENARQYDKGVVGGYSGTFPLTAASQGGIYLLPSTGKFYVCETAYNGAQISAPNSNFVELSVWKNHDRLANLSLSGGLELLYTNMNSYYLYINKMIFFTIYINVSNNGSEINGAIAKLPNQFYYPYKHLTTPIAVDYQNHERVYKAYIDEKNNIVLNAKVTDTSLGVIIYGFTTALN